MAAMLSVIHGNTIDIRRSTASLAACGLNLAGYSCCCGGHVIAALHSMFVLVSHEMGITTWCKQPQTVLASW